MFQPYYTMDKFGWPESRAIEGMPIVRAIRTATVQLPRFIPKYWTILDEELQRRIPIDSSKEGSCVTIMNFRGTKSLNVQGYVSLPLFDTTRYLMMRIQTL